MEDDKIQDIIREINDQLAEDEEYPMNGKLLYVQIDYDFIEPSIYKDRGADVLYRDPDLDRICDPLFALWNAQQKDDRWLEMEYMIRDGQFTITFTYREEIDPMEDPSERRTRIVRKHFGDKPVVYPPPPDDDDGLTFRL